MRKLFMAIMIPVLVVLGTPALALTLMYDGTGNEHLPVHLYTDEYDAQEMIFEELDLSIEELQDGTSEDLVFNLSQDVINRAIYEGILEMNPNYAPGDDCANDDECYIFAEQQQVEGYNFGFRIIGAWVSFYDGASASDPGRFVFNVFAEININNDLSYQTVLEVHFLFDDDPDYYYLEFDKLQMGSLPMPKSLFSSVIGIAEDQGDIDFEEEIGDLPIGEFDLQNLSYTLQKDEILTKIAEETEGNQDVGALLAQELLSIVFDNQLVQFDLVDEEFTLTAGVSQFRNTDPDKIEIPEYLYDLHDKELVDGEEVIGEFNPDLFDPEAYIQDVFTTWIFNSALLDTEFADGGGFEIQEEIFNKLIYHGAGGFADTRTVQEIPISDTETKTIEFGLKAIWFEFEEEDIYAHALFRIAGIDSKLVIRAENVSTSADELQFEFVEITFGKDEAEASTEYIEILDLAVFKQVFAELGDVEFGEFTADGDLVISAAGLSQLMQDGTEDGAVVVNAIALRVDALALDVEAGDPALQQTLEDFTTALNDIIGSEELTEDLEDILDTTGGGVEQEVYESVVDLQNTLANDETPTEEQVEELVENFVDLDPETQEEFLETLGNLVDPELLEDYEDLFGSFDDGEEIPLP
jgi:hypothetical protein